MATVYRPYAFEFISRGFMVNQGQQTISWLSCTQQDRPLKRNKATKAVCVIGLVNSGDWKGEMLGVTHLLKEGVQAYRI